MTPASKYGQSGVYTPNVSDLPIMLFGESPKVCGLIIRWILNYKYVSSLELGAKRIYSNKTLRPNDLPRRFDRVCSVARLLLVGGLFTDLGFGRALYKQ